MRDESGAPTVVVFESESRWVPELERQFVESDVRVRGCRSLVDVRRLANEGGPNVAVFDLPSDPAGCLRFLTREARGIPAHYVVIGSRGTADLEWAVRELGAVSFPDEYVPGSRLAAICRRQWERPV